MINDEVDCDKWPPGHLYKSQETATRALFRICERIRDVSNYRVAPVTITLEDSVGRRAKP
jgi:hypothetical protein